MEREVKLTTFAATGYRQALEQAVPAGQRVTAVVRNPKKLSGRVDIVNCGPATMIPPPGRCRSVKRQTYQLRLP
jgi:hypothetical protein